MTELKIRESVQEKEAYGMGAVQILAVYFVLAAVFAAYFSVFKIGIRLWAADAILLIPVLVSSLVLRGKRGRKKKAALLLAVAAACSGAGNLFHMRGIAPFVNSFVQQYNRFYETSLPMVEGEVRREGVLLVLVGIQLLLAAVLLLAVRAKRAGIPLLLVLALPAGLAAVVGRMPSWAASWGLVAAGTFYRIVSHQRGNTVRQKGGKAASSKQRLRAGAAEDFLRNVGSAGVVLGILYVCCMFAAPKIEAYREAHRPAYQNIKNTLVDAQQINLGEIVSEKLSGMVGGSNYSEGGIGKGNLSGLEEHRSKGTREMEVVLNEWPESRVYLRAYTGTTYTGSKWKELGSADFAKVVSPIGGGKQKEALFNIPFRRLEAGASFENRDTMQIKVLNASTEFAYSPYYAKVPAGAGVHLDSYIEGNGKREWNYTFFRQGAGSVAAVKEEEALWETYRAFVAEHYVECPENLTELRTLAGSLNRSSVDAVEESIGKRFQNLSYSLTPGKKPAGKDFAEYFLFENRKGFCVHFATAATLLYRECGYPARYVEGYTIPPSAFHKQADGTYKAVVTDEMAHAWCETFDDTLGWQVREHTGPYTGTTHYVVDENQVQQPAEKTPVNEPPADEEPVDTNPADTENPDDDRQNGEDGQKPDKGENSADNPENEDGTTGENTGASGKNGGADKADGSGTSGGRLTAGAVRVLRGLLLLIGTLSLGMAILLIQQKIRYQKKMYRFRRRKENRGIASMYQAVYELCVCAGRKTADLREELPAEKQVLEQMKREVTPLTADEWDWLHDCAQRAAFGEKSIPKEEWKQMFRLYKMLRKAVLAGMSRGQRFWAVYVRGC